MNGFRQAVKSICTGLPGAEVSTPFGPDYDTWKVGEKIFATAGDDAHGVSVKTPDVETASMLIDAGVGRRAPYFHKSWVNLPEDAPSDELRHRLIASYDIVRASLTKKIQASLPERRD